MKIFFLVCVLFSFSVNVYSQSINSSPHKISRDFYKENQRFSQHKNKMDWKIRTPELKPDFISGLTATKIDSMYSVVFDDTSLYRFSYDAMGYVASYNKYIKKGNSWNNSTRKFYTNNSFGKVEIELFEVWESNNWTPYYRTTYTFDSYGYFATEAGERFTSTGWVNEYRMTFTRNSSGIVTGILSQEWNNNKWEDNSRTQIQFNPNGKITSYSVESWNGTNWFLRYLFTYSFTEWGDLLAYYSESNSSYLESSKWRQTNTFNSQKQLIKELYENNTGAGWIPSSRTTHQYELSNLVDKKTLENWDDTVWVNSSYQIDSLDQNKNLIRHYEYNWSNNSWIPSFRETYSYNSKGKEINYSKEEYSNLIWNPAEKREFVYDPTSDFLTYFKYSAIDNGASYYPGLIFELDVASNLNSTFDIQSSELKIWYKNVVVPVELTSFSGNCKNGTVSLKWNTATETNNRGFEVERKTTNSGWVSLGFVAGAGTTAKPTNYIFEDKNMPEGRLYYRLKQIDFDGSVSYPQQIEVNTVAIKDFSLAQNYPNPFNPSTVINFSLPSECKVRVNIYNTTGQLVKELVNGMKEAGNYNIKFDASQLSSGIYFYTIQADQANGKESFRNTKKMILMK